MAEAEGRDGWKSRREQAKQSPVARLRLRITDGLAMVMMPLRRGGGPADRRDHKADAMVFLETYWGRLLTIAIALELAALIARF